ncbi:MAG: ATP-binding cassette domain-containing protein [Pseudohongiellaceae bacterium]
MPLLTLKDIHLAYGPQVLLNAENMIIEAGDIIGLLGRNGAGKSSLLKLLHGDIRPDGGERWLKPGARVAMLEQELPFKASETVYEFVAGGLARTGALLSQYHQLIADDAPDMKKLERLQQEIDSLDGWKLQLKVDTVISQLDLPADTLMSALSGGWTRRAALARALVSEPDILLLDEPTNHLDIPAIEWLEQLLMEFRGAIVLITHDRAFLQRTANRIMELDRGQLIYWQHDYRAFLEHRDQQLAAEAKTNAEFDKKLAREEEWIRQGIKARRTRNEGRVRALEKMREEAKARRNLQGNARMTLNKSELSGKIVVEAEGIRHGYDGKTLIDHFSINIMRGDRIGLIGPNGTGKTTLLKILLGQITPDHGKVKTGTKIDIAYFDQLREQLDPEKSVQDNLAGGSDHVTINGRDMHVISYLQDFLFEPGRIRQPVKALSGGEQNRLILARLFSKPANVLVLDEPTNDLDMETLELLEEILLKFEGTLLLVSHDRAFLDNVITSCIVFEGYGQVNHFVGGYQDWVSHGGHFADEKKAADQPDAASAPKPQKPQPQQPAKPGKLSYKLQRELDMLPGEIEKAEAALHTLEKTISDPTFYNNDPQKVDATLKQVAAAQEALDKLYARWEEIEQGQQ